MAYTNTDGVALLGEQERDGYSQYYQQEKNKKAFVYLLKGRPAFAYGELQIQAGQRIIGDPTGLLWMDGDIEVDTSMRGGCCASILRSCSGEPCCLNTYIGTGPDQKVSIGFELPGDLLSFGVTPQSGWVLTQQAFVAGTDNLQISSRFSSCLTCCCADEGIFLTKINAKHGEMGVFVAGGYGMLERHDVPSGETLVVSAGLFFAAKDDTSFDVGLIGQECCGLKNLCCTNGGIVLRFSGPTVVYTQSRNPMQLYRQFGIGGKGPVGRAIKVILKIISTIAEQAG